MEKHLLLESIEMNIEINKMFQRLNKILLYKGINYKDLKNSLVPQKNRKEILLVFDSTKIEESFYGKKIIEDLLPQFGDDSIHSVKVGDYVGGQDQSSNILLLNLLKQYIFLPESIVHCTQLFFVYVNNLSEQQFDKFQKVGEEISSCIGAVNLTYSSYLKDYCSFILSGVFIKYRKKVISSHEDDRDDEDNINITGYPFEDFNYEVLSIPENLYGVFLNYKIECNTTESDKKDIYYSLTSISKKPKNIIDFDVLIEDEKLLYLRNEKRGVLKRLDYMGISKSEIELRIKSKIESSYLYNLNYSSDHNVSKFNVLLELTDLEHEIYRVVISLHYMLEEKKLRVITLY